MYGYKRNDHTILSIDVSHMNYKLPRSKSLIIADPFRPLACIVKWNKDIGD